MALYMDAIKQCFKQNTSSLAKGQALISLRLVHGGQSRPERAYSFPIKSWGKGAIPLAKRLGFANQPPDLWFPSPAKFAVPNTKQPGQGQALMSDYSQASSRPKPSGTSLFLPHQEMGKGLTNVEVNGKVAPRGGGNWGGKSTCRL
ncbi:hypothetical protein BK138_30470 [Paenibacillus rhizosphaerae]|uniref:Uncharacterized protein n=1 Tax=Paenibacillus rhizosphaerae TaxID=297318 RepID=A0A1R1EAQ3_9BACL|nr:hypothetical protein BK138_30470 [Paenibacillus rhizosphaerae]